MLKRFLALLLLVPGLVLASQYEAGKQYEVLTTPATEKPEVVEFFSFFCPHCKAFEPYIQQLERSLPKGQKLTRNHVDFLRAASPELQQELAKAFVVADHAGQGDQISNAIFRYIHEQRASFNSVQDIRSLMLVNDIPAMVFDAGMVNPDVTMAVKTMKERQDFYSKAEVLRGVPTLIVNGKYRVIMAGLDKDNFQSDLNGLIAYLLAKKD